ncbi:MAG: SpoIIE family protein phosphatase, partial [Lachnospiraceae bacterium]|nr:SpoIIE family protein phosphatase [Lachnospiraceae bacterium]
ALFFTGGVSIFGLYSMRDISKENSRELGNTAALDAEEALAEMAGEQLLTLVEGKASYIEEKFATVISSVNGIAQAAGKIYEAPEKYPDREVPLPEKNSMELAPQLLWSGSLMDTIEGNFADGTSSFLAPSKEQQEEILKLGNIQELLVLYNRNNDMISSTYLATESGWLIQADCIPGLKYTEDHDLPEPFEAKERQWYQLACQAEKETTVYSDVMVDFHEGKDCIICARAIYVGDEVVAVAGIGSYLDTVKEAVWNSAVGETGYSFLVNQAGQVMISGAGEGETAVQAGGKADLRVSENKELAAAVDKMLCGESGLMKLMLEGRAVYLAYTPLEELGWGMATVMDVEEVLAPALQSQQEILELAEEVLRQQDVTIHRMISFYCMAAALTAVVIIMAGILFAGKLTAPIHKLTQEAARIGRGNLDERIQIMTGDEVEELGDAFNKMVAKLKTYIADLAETTARQERIQTELNLASRIQADMLPDTTVFCPKRKAFVLHACMTPAKEVGGDFYDFFPIDEDRLAFLIADVSGKGVPASLFMVVAKTLLQSYIAEGDALDEAVSDVNGRLCAGNESGMFVTAWIGVLTLSTGELVYVNAGHNAPLIGNRQKGYSYLTEKNGFVLAGLEDVAYSRHRLQLVPGDFLFLYTDGVTEMNDAAGNLYGEERLKTLLNGSRETEPEKLAEAVMEDIRSFQGKAEQFDDVTMLVVAYTGETEKKKAEMTEMEITVPAQIDHMQEVQSFVEKILEQHDVSGEDSYRVLTAFDELFSNICHYSEAKEIRTSCSVSEEEIVLHFEDDGIPFYPWGREIPDTEAPFEERTEGGLGIYMIQELMDEVTYRYDEEKNKNQLKRKRKKDVP